MPVPEEFIKKLMNHMVRNSNYCCCPVSLDNMSHTILDYAWLYYRPYGIMSVNSGMHIFIQAIFVGLEKYDEIYEKYIKMESKQRFHMYFFNECNSHYDEWSDEFFSLPGTCSLSNVSYRDVAIVKEFKNLTKKELEILQSNGTKIVTKSSYDDGSFLKDMEL